MNIPQTDIDYKFWKSLDKEEYKKTKDELIAVITAQIVKQFPELDGKIELLDCWTPMTYTRYCNAYHGAYMSFVTTVGAKQLRVRTSIWQASG